MDLSGVSPEAAVMAVANQKACATATQAGLAVLARTERETRDSADALIQQLIQTPVVKPGVGGNIDVYA